MSSRVGHVTTETVFGQTLALWLGNRDEHRALESDTTGLNVKWNLYLYLSLGQTILTRKTGIHTRQGLLSSCSQAFFSLCLLLLM